jgi:NADP-dependent 3-hydroxy acid dehydrogenase YdfG
MTDLAHTVVAVTGASSGIGAAIVDAFAGEGAALALGARRGNRIDDHAKRINDAGGRAISLPTDVCDEAQASAFVQGTRERFGRIDVLVNNAGVALLGPVCGAPTDEWRRMIDVNVMGPLYCSHAALPIMLEQGAGHIVNIGSTGGRVARAGAAVYNLTKFAIGAFSEALRQEGAPEGIRVTHVLPGYVRTELQNHQRPEVRAAIGERFKGVVPLDPATIAEAVVYAVRQPPSVSVNEIVVRPTSQPY